MIVVCVLLGIAILKGLGTDATSQSNDDASEQKPLYWVAPMDANYRRDKPGKSPMGMDLVPVYQESNNAEDLGAGTVKISANVINNLGVKTVKAQEKILPHEIETVGYVQYDEDTLVHIHPRVEGWIEKLYIKAVGEPVKKDQPLYTLYSPQLVNAQEEYLIALKRNNKTLINAAQQRLMALQLSKSFIQSLKRSKTVKQSVTFFAPKSGVLDDLKIREGFYVKPGNTLMSIGDLTQVWVEAEIFERDSNLVNINDVVLMRLDHLPTKEWRGNIDYIYPSLNTKNRTLRVRIKFGNPEKLLKPNMYANILINTAVHQASIVVPTSAVIRTGKQNRVVLALGQGAFKSIEVSLGRSNNDEIEIVSGLKTGDEIVSSAQFLIDSESSINSDFKRIDDDVSYPSASVAGVINEININNLMLNISREAIEKWDRPATTMDFIVARGVDLSGLELNSSIVFTFEIREAGFVITNIESVEAPALSKDSASTKHSNH